MGHQLGRRSGNGTPAGEEVWEWDTSCLIGLTLMQKRVWQNSPHQGGVTPIDSIVTAATVGQNFDRLFSAV